MRRIADYCIFGLRTAISLIILGNVNKTETFKRIKRIKNTKGRYL